MRTRIVRIGNSQGVRIPKLLLKESGLGEEVELEARRNQIIIRGVGEARRDWAAAFAAMAARGDDVLLDPDVLEDAVWDEEEWEW